MKQCTYTSQGPSGSSKLFKLCTTLGYLSHQHNCKVLSTKIVIAVCVVIFRDDIVLSSVKSFYLTRSIVTVRIFYSSFWLYQYYILYVSFSLILFQPLLTAHAFVILYMWVIIWNMTNSLRFLLSRYMQYSFVLHCNAPSVNDYEILGMVLS